MCSFQFAQAQDKKNCSVKSVKGFSVIQEINLGVLYQHLNEEAFSILLNAANMHTIYWGLHWMRVRSRTGALHVCSMLHCSSTPTGCILAGAAVLHS